jgi:hypothetical protein
MLTTHFHFVLVPKGTWPSGLFIIFFFAKGDATQWSFHFTLAKGTQPSGLFILLLSFILHIQLISLHALSQAFNNTCHHPCITSHAHVITFQSSFYIHNSIIISWSYFNQHFTILFHNQHVIFTSQYHLLVIKHKEFSVSKIFTLAAWFMAYRWVLNQSRLAMCYCIITLHDTLAFLTLNPQLALESLKG